MWDLHVSVAVDPSHRCLSCLGPGGSRAYVTPTVLVEESST
jgi:hypothetical protein